MKHRRCSLLAEPLMTSRTAINRCCGLANVMPTPLARRFPADTLAPIPSRSARRRHSEARPCVVSVAIGTALPTSVSVREPTSSSQHERSLAPRPLSGLRYGARVGPRRPPWTQETSRSAREAGLIQGRSMRMMSRKASFCFACSADGVDPLWPGVGVRSACDT
jgi:hypothetical protein